MPSTWITMHTHTRTHPFNGPFSRTTPVSRYQKGKTNLDFTEARNSEWQWHQLGCMQVCISLQTDNHASTPPLKFFYRPDALPAAQPTASKHWRHIGSQCIHKLIMVTVQITIIYSLHMIIITKKACNHKKTFWILACVCILHLKIVLWISVRTQNTILVT